VPSALYLVWHSCRPVTHAHCSHPMMQGSGSRHLDSQRAQPGLPGRAVRRARRSPGRTPAFHLFRSGCSRRGARSATPTRAPPRRPSPGPARRAVPCSVREQRQPSERYGRGRGRRGGHQQQERRAGPARPAEGPRRRQAHSSGRDVRGRRRRQRWPASRRDGGRQRPPDARETHQDGHFIAC